MHDSETCLVVYVPERGHKIRPKSCYQRYLLSGLVYYVHDVYMHSPGTE